MDELTIRFVSDYVCPYCIAAKKTLMEAVEELKTRGYEIRIEWIPFELTRQGEIRPDTYHDEARKERWQRTLEPFCEEIGLKIQLPPRVIPRPYTYLTFEGYHYAAEHGAGDKYNDLVYEAYFQRGQDIGDPQVLTELAAELQLDPDAFQSALEEGRYRKQQQEAARYSREELGVRSVPTIWSGPVRVNGGLHSKEEWLAIIMDSMKTEQEQLIEGSSCGINGCEDKKSIRQDAG